MAELQKICEAAIPTANADGTLTGSFQMAGLQASILGLKDVDDVLPGLAGLRDQVGPIVCGHAFKGVIRNAFLIEPVLLPAATTTRFKTRWSLPAADPRYASVEECQAIAIDVISRLTALAESEEGRLILEGLSERSMVPYELPVGYAERRDPIHRADNVGLFDLELLRHVAGFRLLLLNPDNPLRPVFAEAYKRKIAVKTYLTDRALTGTHKTNREKRWEAHPDSVQFALRDTCLQIELVLVNQMCHFEGFPAELRDLLIAADLLLPMDVARCPVTLLPLRFDDFSAEVLSPVQGKSAFQVGHLDPLKLDGNVWANGHRADNIGWISADGNRIQGSLSVDEIRELLRRVWVAYSEAGLLDL